MGVFSGQNTERRCGGTALGWSLGPHEKGKGRDEGGAQDGRLTITGAEKYARVCREGAVLGTGRSAFNFTSETEVTPSLNGKGMDLRASTLFQGRG
jgi:hypothetical protein